MPKHFLLLLALTVSAVSSQVPPQGHDPLQRAYRALQEKQFELAIAAFREAVQAAPNLASIRKDLAYALLKTGETVAARDQFAEAMRLAPDDWHTALEYAFLCHETGKVSEARRIFAQAAESADPDLRATARQAFENIDRPLREGISRWTEALSANPDDWNAHREMATLAEQRGEFALAAEHFLKAWRLRPSQTSWLVDYGRLSLLAGRMEDGRAALLAASRSSEPRAAEAARKLLEPRYPYVYEFRQAIQLDPENTTLRLELAHLLAAMGRQQESEIELVAIPNTALPSRPQPTDAALREAKEMAARSYRAGYLKDAIRYSLAAHERDPLDFEVILQLAWACNVLGRDDEAMRWFRLARRSPDPAIAREAGKAYRALRPSQAAFRFTGWFYPSYSSRWQDVFAYGQWKGEWKLSRLPARAYLSARFVGNRRQLSNEARPQYLSESSLIPAVGLASGYWHGAMLWAEAGVAQNYRDGGRNLPRRQTDVRAGVSFARGVGTLLGSKSDGFFAETNDDAVFLSHFDNDLILFSQNRAGFTFKPWAALGGLESQFYLSVNASADSLRQYWANTSEAGPGIRFRWSWMPPSWLLSVSWVRGGYRIMEGNPRNRMYSDLRLGFWYAFQR